MSIAHAYIIDRLTGQMSTSCRAWSSPPISCTRFCTCPSDSRGKIRPYPCVSSVIPFGDPDNALSAVLRHQDKFSQAMVINTDPSTQQHTIVVVCIVAPICSSLFTVIRVWTRVFIVHSVGWDDCRSSHLSLLETSLSHNIDAAIFTLVMLTPAFAHFSLTNGIKQPFYIAFSILISLGMLVAL